MNARKITAFALAIIICISLAACGGDSAGEAGPEESVLNSFVGRWISDDDPNLAYIFDEDLSFRARQGESETLAGTYTYTAASATATAGDEGQVSIYFELITEGTITANDGSGPNDYFRRVTDEDTTEANPRLGATLTTENADGSFTTEYYDLKLKATYPETFSLSEVVLPEVAMLLTDGNKGFFLLRDLTDYYGRFSGTPDDFVTAYINDYIYPDFGAIFGGYPDYTDFNITHPDIENRFATADIELYSGENDIEVVIHISALRDEAGKITTVTAAAWLAPRMEREQLASLQTLVTDFGPIIQEQEK